jgi:small subunit ribosomal protein S4
MGRQTTARCKLCRREGEKLFLKGEKCATEKCPFSRRSYAPGQHGKVPVRAGSEYRIRLREKQKARRIYGLTEGQFEKYFEQASRSRGATGEMLLELLERRLDNVVFRFFTSSRQAARQMVLHGGIEVNGRKVNVPSFKVKVNDVIKVRPSYTAAAKLVAEKLPDRTPPAWLAISGENEGKVVALPKREDIDTKVELHLIVEYYSR